MWTNCHTHKKCINFNLFSTFVCVQYLLRWKALSLAKFTRRWIQTIFTLAKICVLFRWSNERRPLHGKRIYLLIVYCFDKYYRTMVILYFFGSPIEELVDVFGHISVFRIAWLNFHRHFLHSSSPLSSADGLFLLLQFQYPANMASLERILFRLGQCSRYLVQLRICSSISSNWRSEVASTCSSAIKAFDWSDASFISCWNFSHSCSTGSL